jgi:hypothetical protein
MARVRKAYRRCRSPSQTFPQMASASGADRRRAWTRISEGRSYICSRTSRDNVPCVGIDRDDCGGRGRLAGGLTQKHSSVKKNLPGRIELLQEIKIKNIAGEHGAAILPSPATPTPNLGSVSGTLQEAEQECPRPSFRSRIQSAEGPQSRDVSHELRWQPVGSVRPSQATRPRLEVRAYPHRRAGPFRPASLAGFVELHY